MADIQDTLFGRMFPEHSLLTAVKISDQSCKPSARSSRQLISLDLRSGGGSGRIMGDGFSIAWRCMDAQYWGVPQRRRRVYLVADFDGRSADKILFESEMLPRHFCKGRTPWQDNTSDADGCTSRVYECHSQDSRVKELHGVSETVAAKYGTGGATLQ